ncbi:hypothetical protein [Brevibacillus laterosporus]|uniref:hypothetical protein n=1 Tax=Brevibacillus laterosporus TaxID=1465 RepID=UPI00215C7EEF|nr:hypothetical protein [Brevibacillus laterosporus]MCR8994677.1 hypothetical protein [Brevibacillus laterosporus]
MKLVINKKLTNNNYEVVLKLEDIQPEEEELFNDFGNPSINIGGALTKKGASSAETAVGDAFKYLPTDFPITKVFTHASHGEKAENVAIAFIDTMTLRIETAISALKAKSDSFTGSTEVQL